MKLGLRLVNSVQGEIFLISQLVRLSMLSLALQPVWEGLAEHQWSEGQLADFEASLSSLDFLADYQSSVRSEVGFQAPLFDLLRHRPEMLEQLGKAEDRPTSTLQGELLSRLIPSGWFYQNQLRCARFMIQYNLPLVDWERRDVSPTATKHAAAALDAEISRRGPYNFLEAMLLPAAGGAVKKFAQTQTTVDLARLACGLERHRLAHGQFPDTLATLAPQFIEKVPHDVINGQPLHYRRTDSGQFLLYSVGWNETDDGGKVALNKGSTPGVDAEQGDWVWPMPAK